MKLLPTTLLTWLALAGTAYASEAEPARDNGEGWAGETTDKVVTFFSLGVVVFFTVFVILASWLQSVLDRRKERRKAAHFQRYGW